MPDVVPVAFGQDVGEIQHGERGAKEEEHVKDVPKDGLYPVPADAALLPQRGHGPIQAPSSRRLVVDELSGRVEHNAVGGPRLAAAAVDAEGELVENDKPAENRQVDVEIGLVPAERVGVIDVRCKNWPSRSKARGSPAVHDQFPVSVGAAEAEALRRDDHETGGESVANAERPRPPHRQGRKRGEDGLIGQHVDSPIPVIRGGAAPNVSSEYSMKKTKKRAGNQPAEQVEAVDEIDGPGHSDAGSLAPTASSNDGLV